MGNHVARVLRCYQNVWVKMNTRTISGLGARGHSSKPCRTLVKPATRLHLGLATHFYIAGICRRGHQDISLKNHYTGHLCCYKFIRRHIY